MRLEVAIVTDFANSVQRMRTRVLGGSMREMGGPREEGGRAIDAGRSKPGAGMGAEQAAGSRIKHTPPRPIRTPAHHAVAPPEHTGSGDTQQNDDEAVEVHVASLVTRNDDGQARRADTRQDEVASSRRGEGGGGRGDQDGSSREGVKRNLKRQPLSAKRYPTSSSTSSSSSSASCRVLQPPSCDGSAMVCHESAVDCSDSLMVVNDHAKVDDDSGEVCNGSAMVSDDSVGNRRDSMEAVKSKVPHIEEAPGQESNVELQPGSGLVLERERGGPGTELEGKPGLEVEQKLELEAEQRLRMDLEKKSQVELETKSRMKFGQTPGMELLKKPVLDLEQKHEMEVEQRPQAELEKKYGRRLEKEPGMELDQRPEMELGRRGLDLELERGGPGLEPNSNNLHPAALIPAVTGSWEIAELRELVFGPQYLNQEPSPDANRNPSPLPISRGGTTTTGALPAQRPPAVPVARWGPAVPGRVECDAAAMGEGMRRRAHRAVVVEGLCPPFGVGAACVVKVHSALGEGGQPGPQLVESNRRLAVQECWVQGAARQLCRRFASEASALPGFGSTPEVIPLYLLTRPGRPAAHATVEVQLPGRFAKYSPRDGRELSAGAPGAPSEAAMKCVAFQHWVFVRSGGRLLVTDLQGVGLHLTDVGIATRDKEFQGVRGNFPSSALAQFVALHECSPHCALLGLGPLRRASRAPPPPHAAGGGQARRGRDPRQGTRGQVLAPAPQGHHPPTDERAVTRGFSRSAAPFATAPFATATSLGSPAPLLTGLGWGEGGSGGPLRAEHGGAPGRRGVYAAGKVRPGGRTRGPHAAPLAANSTDASSSSSSLD
ncbi:unnamed protein product [Lampetra planeri]